MFEAQYLFSSATAGDAVFSPWIPRGGDHCKLTVDLVQVNGAKLAIELQTKNSETAGDTGSPMASQSALSAAGVQTTFASTAASLELVRYKFTCTANENGTMGYVLFRMLSPVWFDAVDA